MIFWKKTSGDSTRKDDLTRKDVIKQLLTLSKQGIDLGRESKKDAMIVNACDRLLEGGEVLLRGD